MITIILTYRNREISIVKKCLDALKGQSESRFCVKIVDYGSHLEYSESLKQLVQSYAFVNLMEVPVTQQLWNKSKAINMALKSCDTPYCFIGDIDMIYRNDFIEKLHRIKKENEATYFQVGFLTQEESSKNKPFEAYVLKHITNEEATGMTLYPTELLKSINGYDEFYHGWGAEDSDVHARLKHRGVPIRFYKDAVLLLHQWHSRDYRSNQSKEPYHSYLEQINHHYYQQVLETKKILANQKYGWGNVPNKTDFKNGKAINLTNEKSAIDAFFMGQLQELNWHQIQITIFRHADFKTLKNSLKKRLGKKHKTFYSFQELNDKILMVLISSYRDRYYEYTWDKEMETIKLKLALT